MEGTNRMSPNADKQNSATEPTAGFNAGQVEGSVFCRKAAVSEMTNPFPWARASTASECSHWEEVQRMVQEFEDTKEVVIRGVSLSVAQVAAVAKKPNVTVSLDSGSSARKNVDESSDWVAENMKMAAGFGANSATAHSRTSQGAELQHELIRFLNAGVLVEDGVNTLPVATTRAAILVRINSLLQGYSGIRWEILEALAKLLNERITPKVPLRGGLENLVPLAYIAGLLIGRPNSRATTMSGEEVTGIEALKLVGITEPFELRPKEGIALVNGSAVGSGLASTVSYDANVLTLFTEIATALFCEVMHGKPEFTDHLTHKLKHHPGQIEAAAIMEWVLEGSSYMKATAKLRENDPLKKAKQDRYALRTAPQWLGPQIEVIRAATHAIEREINSVNDNPIIDVSRSKSLQGGSFLSSPIGVAMDNMRLALAALGKLMFAQMSELVSGIYSNGLPANLPGGPNPSLDYGLKGAEIAMASYCSELQYLANPVTTHVQSAEQHNQDVNSLGLISARKTAESIDVLRLMASTFLVTLCQAVDLRHLEENMQASLKEVVSMAAKKALLVDSEGQKLFSGFLKSNLSKVVDDQSPFACSDNPWNASNPLMRNLRHSLVAYAMDNTDGDEGRNLLKRIIIFEVEVRAQLEAAIPVFRERFDNGVTSLPNRIVDCRSYPLYSFVRSLGTKLLVGTNSRCPGQDIEKVYSAILKGELAAPLLKCLDGWSGTPTPVDCPQ